MSTLYLLRLRFAVRGALLHFSLSFIAVVIIGALVFGIWFPWPYREVAGGGHLFLLILSVDVVCGPLLTLILLTPTKSRSELVRDMTLIVAVQLVALSYGLNTLALARPIALVFEVDRFRAVSMTDLDGTDSISAPNWLRAWSLSGPKLVGTRRASNKDEMLENIEKSSAGIEMGQRPNWWQDYALNASDALARAKSVSELAAKYPTQRALINEAVVRTGRPESSLRWLPLVSHRALDWTALIDAKTAVPVGYVHLDGF